MPLPPQSESGRTETFRRLNRTEYQNAIRDLLALDVDVAALLPPDEVQPRLRQHHGGRSLADAAESLHLGGSEDQPLAVGRAAASRQEDIFAFVPTSRRTHISRVCRSARAAAC